MASDCSSRPVEKPETRSVLGKLSRRSFLQLTATGVLVPSTLLGGTPKQGQTRTQRFLHICPAA